MPVCVRLIAYEALGYALVALAASRLQICWSDRRLCISGGKNLVFAVAIPAASGLNVAESRHLRVEGIPIGFFLVLVALAAGSSGLDVPGNLARTRDFVGAMAIGANRSFLVTHLEQLAVNSC